MTLSPEPVRVEFDQDDPTGSLVAGVRNALAALPGEFSFRHQVSGIQATDLFNLNSLMGAGIELEVVRALNGLRQLWDPGQAFTGYSFERSSQAFPDVRLVRREGGVEKKIAIGIELKGWFTFAKEGVPSLRYQVTPAACAEPDLVCVVPWWLSEAVSGEAVVGTPWVESARYAAEYRDYWWQHLRGTAGSRKIAHPPGAEPYPSKADQVHARPAEDHGGNFGRLPRCKPLMDSFIEGAMKHPVLGIPTRNWVSFLKVHTDRADQDAVTATLQARLTAKDKKAAPDQAERILAAAAELADFLP